MLAQGKNKQGKQVNIKTDPCDFQYSSNLDELDDLIKGLAKSLEVQIVGS
ncbi:hypothetical protein ACFL35_18200 [Candidatus Riflebacteria bacterium]